MWSWGKRIVKPFIKNLNPDPCECSQNLNPKPTGYKSSQCPEYYCEVCRIGFWVCEIKPDAEQINLEKKTNPDATGETMKYYALRKKPMDVWGKSSETQMIDQLGGKLPWFLSKEKKEYWMKKYEEKYPNSDLVKHRKKLRGKST